MKLFYHTARYISHRTAGIEYIKALRGAGYTLVADADAADLVIIHDDVRWYPALVEAYGHKPMIGYAVWEMDVLPDGLAPSLARLEKIWTCSPHARHAFRNSGLARVEVVPHIVAPPSPSAQDMEKIRRAIGYSQGTHYFYAVLDTANPRKGAAILLRAFAAAFCDNPNIRLVIKQYAHPWDLGRLAGVVSIDEDLTPGEIAALHALCHTYVSPHHCEGWGLSLSEAMACGNPVIATGFSGNMFYMNADNSFPIKYTLSPLSREMCQASPLYGNKMLWAVPNEKHLVYLMRKVAAGRFDPSVLEKARNTMAKFTHARIGAVMKHSIDVMGL